jgi:hypothetical protein
MTSSTTQPAWRRGGAMRKAAVTGCEPTVAARTLKLPRTAPCATWSGGRSAEPAQSQRASRHTRNMHGGSGFGRLGPGSMGSQAAHAQTARRGRTLGERG